jgi:CRP-like cAMP-binding protein
MALDDDVRILSDVKLFGGFTAEQVRLIAFGAERIGLAAGKRLFRQADEADSAYVVVSGTIRVFNEDRGQEAALTVVGPGTLLGELALIADTRRLTSAVAETDAELIRLDRRSFRRILEEYPETAVALYKRISEDFQALVRRIEDLAPRFSD